MQEETQKQNRKEFYINYEECKFANGLSISNSYDEFYINYEECKFDFLKFRLWNIICFILTMRNVNAGNIQE